jgi:LssY C-terminus
VRPPQDTRVLWVGAGTRDTGISLTKLTFQVTHATDDDTNTERDYIVAELMKHRVIEDVTSYQAGQHLPVGRINHYIADGTLSVASLMVAVV